MNNAAEYVATQRQKKGLTQRELADLLHMDKSAIGRIETGSLPIGKETCQAIIALFELNAADSKALMKMVFEDELERTRVSLVNNILRATDKLTRKYPDDGLSAIAKTLPDQVIAALRK